MERYKFLEQIGNFGLKYAPRYEFKCVSPMIAQAILELGWKQVEDETGLFPYNNFYGLKCGSAWTGKSVNMITKEEFNGTMYDIRDNFRIFDSFEQGVEGYYDFLNWSNYANLKNVSDPYTYLELIKADGYATASNYVDSVYKIIDDYDLTDWDKKLREPLKFGVGDTISYTKLHFTAYDNYPCVPYITKGKITKIIEGANNPYLINDNVGWVRECDITEELPIAIGDIVKVINPITYDGQPFKAWYKHYEVMEIVDDRIVIGVDGIVTCAINVKNIEKV